MPYRIDIRPRTVKAVLSFALTGALNLAWAQGSGPHTLSATLADPGTPAKVAKQGPSVFAEGVASDWSGNVYSNEMDMARRTMRLAVGSDTSKAWRTAIDKPNGIWLDQQNRLVICQTRALVRVKAAEVFDNLTDTLYAYPAGTGRDFNDVTGDSQDNLYFTNFEGRSVYFRDAATGQTREVLSNRPKPNGIEWDEERKVVYVCENEAGKVAAYSVGADFTLTARRDFASVPASDGIVLDELGNVYVVAFGSAVHVYAPDGSDLGRIPLSGNQVTNLAFGGADFKTLYMITNVGLYRLPMKVKGYKTGKPSTVGLRPYRIPGLAAAPSTWTVERGSLRPAGSVSGSLPGVALRPDGRLVPIPLP
jgi:sugar lactone lactonase YvrE